MLLLNKAINQKKCESPIRKSKRIPRAILDEFFSKKQPTLTVLIPSYREEYQVVRKTLLSAALQEYPKIRIVLLLDDNPNQTDLAEPERLAKMRQIENDLKLWLQTPQRRFSKALADYETSETGRRKVSNQMIEALSDQYKWAANWLIGKADEERIEDHVDQFFTAQVLRQLGKELVGLSHFF